MLNNPHNFAAILTRLRLFWLLENTLTAGGCVQLSEEEEQLQMARLNVRRGMPLRDLNELKSRQQGAAKPFDRNPSFRSPPAPALHLAIIQKAQRNVWSTQKCHVASTQWRKKGPQVDRCGCCPQCQLRCLEHRCSQNREKVSQVF